jgi:hypothetical protein
MTRENDWDIEVRAEPKVARFNDTAIVINSDRWRVVGLGDAGSLDAIGSRTYL